MAEIFASYPQNVGTRLLDLRRLILETATELGTSAIKESVKWGEPSYVVVGGSPIRLGWKPSRPDRLALYFVCSSKLVATFRLLYSDQFEFEGNRALILHVDEVLPVAVLKHCISLALTYHRVKQLANLGVSAVDSLNGDDL